MTAVLIHNSGIGTTVGARNWRATIETAASYRDPVRARTLTAGELRTLEELHPEGRAQFWGTHRFYQGYMRRLAPGDGVIFPGRGKIVGMGRVGLLTDNVALGDSLWSPHPKHGSYRYVYSLAPLALMDMPQVNFRRRGGFTKNDVFRGLRLLDGPRAAQLLAAFAAEIPAPTAASLSPLEQAIDEVRSYEAEDDRVADELPGDPTELPIEDPSGARVVVGPRAGYEMRRGESLLVKAYVAWLGERAVGTFRMRTPAGVTDLHIRWAGEREGEHELVEAKSSTDRVYVRQALAQLLDYAPSLGRPVSCISALFPSRPDADSIALLHRYGVSCVFRTPDGSFARVDAPADSQRVVASLWETGR